MHVVTIQLPESIKIPQELGRQESVELFWMNEEEISLFRDSDGQIRAGGRPIGYRKLDRVPSNGKELEDLLKSLLSNIIHIGFPMFEPG